MGNEEMQALRGERAVYIDDVERLLLRCALEHWQEQLNNGTANAAYLKAGAFTQVQIVKVLAKLKEPDRG